MEIWYILQLLWKDGLSSCTGIWSCLHHKERWHFFFPKIYFFADGKGKMIFLKKYMEMLCFLYIGKGGIFFPTNIKMHFCQKRKDDLFPINILKNYISSITEKDDIHPRKDNIIILHWKFLKEFQCSLYFYGDLFKCFHIFFSNGNKTRKLNLYSQNLTLSVGCMVGDILKWRIFNNLYHPALRSCV